MKDEWIWIWFRCLKLNKQYRQYCEAVRQDDSKTAKALERRYRRIADVFNDFGDIHSFNERVENRKNWYTWLQSHRHLFNSSTVTNGRQTITTSPKYVLAYKQKVGQLQLQTAKRCLAVWHKLEPLPGIPKPTLPQLTKLFASHALGDPKVWDDWSEAKMSRSGNQEDYERQIRRYRCKGQKMIDATVSGVFPQYK